MIKQDKAIYEKHFKSQNQYNIVDLNNNYFIKRTNSGISNLIKVDDFTGIETVLEHYIKVFFVFDKFKMFSVYDGRWHTYKLIDNNYIKIICSDYLFIKYPNLLLEYNSESKLFNICKARLINDIVKIEQNIFVADNFIINNKKMITVYRGRIFMYDLLSDIFENKIKQDENNLIETPKLKIYYDYNKCVDVYQKKNSKLLYSTDTPIKQVKKNQYYIIYHNKIYMLLNVVNNKTLFSGTVILQNDSEKFLLRNIGSNEIMQIDYNNQIIYIFNYNDYQAGIKNILQKIKI